MNLIPWRNKQRSLDEAGPMTDRSLGRLRDEIDEMFERFWRDPFMLAGPEGFASRLDMGPRVNVSEDDEAITVEAELPGVKPDDVDIQVVGGALRISGHVEQEHKDERRNYHYQERRYGTFQRAIPLPNTVDTDKVSAEFKNGVLTVTVAKNPEAKPKRIEVKTS